MARWAKRKKKKEQRKCEVKAGEQLSLELRLPNESQHRVCSRTGIPEQDDVVEQLLVEHGCQKK